MDETGSPSRLGVESLASEEEAPRRRGADPREDEGRDDGRDDPELDLREAEDGVGRGDGHVGTAHEPGAAPERVSLNPADDGGRARVDCLQHPEEPERILDVVVVGKVDRRALPVDVGAGAEAVAVPREDDRARVAGLGEGVGQLADQCRIEGVPPLWPRKGYSQQRPVTLDPQRTHALSLRRRRVTSVLRGALAAAVTPLSGGGETLDEDAFDPLVAFLESAGLDGLLALGTTGEGILLSPGERRRAAELFVAARPDGFAIAIHCGAQTTRETAELAAHAADLGADAVAAIGPPYYALDERALLEHFAAAAQACEPLPFYVYEFAARSGYAVPVGVLDRLRDRAANFAGLKVSDRPWERFETYLIEGLDVFVGPEALIQRGLAGGATGVVSGLATAFPSEVAAAMRGVPGPDLEALRDGLERFPFQAAAKRVLGRRGVSIREDVRAPLRGLTEDEREELDRWLGSL